MKLFKGIVFFAFLMFWNTSLTAQELSSPKEFLGYEIGTQFSRHHQVVDYFKLIAEQSPNIELSQYGETNERRPLYLAYVSSEKNLKDLESIRMNNLAHAGLVDQAAKNLGITVVWLSYNVHGNEASSSEAAMKTVHQLITEKQDWLENTVVIMDPCVNPDGRDRYINWYNEVKSTPYNAHLDSKEHHEGWPGGRPNHYLFDLNRDWAWLSQVESQQRIAVYNKWMPQVHVDFHEQGINEPYYFAPAAEPFHEVITDWQRDFQTAIGRNHAKYFDQEGWLYFTRERFDLFYPSYGDTYPTYMGAIGMTYEQGGHSRGGLGVINSEGETLTLIDRVDHHTTTGLSTVEMASTNASKLVSEFEKFFATTNGTYKNFVLSSKDQDKIDKLTGLLDKHEIKYAYAKGGAVKGYNYTQSKEGRIAVAKNDLVVSINQPKGKMVKVLFEPQATLSDSLTYDITAWALPYAYGIDAAATSMPVQTQSAKPNSTETADASSTYGYVAKWNNLKDATFLSQMMNEGMVVRFTERSFQQNGKTYAPGTLIILKRDNLSFDDFDAKLKGIAKSNGRSLEAVSTGFSDKGVDFGAYNVKRLNKQRIALLSGEGTSSYSFGEIWHFFETQLKYPITIIDTDYVSSVDLSKYDVLIMPNGYYGTSGMDQVKEFARGGGTVIAIGNALNSFNEKTGFSLKRKSLDYSDGPNLKPFTTQERESISNLITGAVFKANLDPTHPLAFGYGDAYFSLKLSGSSYELLTNGGINAGYFPSGAESVSGFAGFKAAEQVPNSLLFGEESFGRGSIIYMVDNPLFRSFWENGKLFMANAVFMCNSDKVRL
ncbi:M14 family metallopeptidase [Flavobacteriaceae bacterium]|nr:M14 family metallopeptidase [Flavobacteriaceae bacterium]